MHPPLYALEEDRTAAPVDAARVRRILSVRGVVQGVGFRPYVFALATRLGLAGSVRNRADGVDIEVEGPPAAVAAFAERLAPGAPAGARIDRIESERRPARGERGFSIAASDPGARAERYFAPDLAACAACLGEVLDPADRRSGYPFATCAACGPRLTIARGAPYDRERTTMAGFALCAACRAEYEDPADRRFHAQPIACPACGPRLVAHNGAGRALDVDPLPHAAERLAAGAILAVKGLGGYHLACDATSEDAVRRLRARKHRDEKPFAVLVADLAAARRLCHVSPAEADLLGAPEGVIALLERRAGAVLAPSVAPGNPLVGLMLPYTPLHHLLIRAAARPLVLTSGNRSDEPIAFEDADAFARLAGIADGFLTHDRPIHLRCDDSVARVTPAGPVVLRRSRGYAPAPIRLPHPAARRVLAVGGHLKNTFALGRGHQAFLSHHLGDLGDWSAYGAFRDAVAHYESLFAFEPEVIAHDLHPGYASTGYAIERAGGLGLPVVAVQHHHAHVASCMAEHRLRGPVIGVAFDGTGYGTDGTLWGGEFLVGGYRSVRRAAHLRAVPLAGGEQAIREPWRMALAHLLDAGEDPERMAARPRPEALRVVRRMVERGPNAPLTSSAGRLFDAAAALLGRRVEASFEGQAAMELEWLAATSAADEVYPFAVTAPSGPERPREIDTRPLVRAMADAVRRGERPADIARRFHNTLAEIIAQGAAALRDDTGIDRVVLTGGVFQNALLAEAASRRLAALGLHVHTHRRVPPNDGGLALGQLAVATVATDAA